MDASLQMSDRKKSEPKHAIASRKGKRANEAIVLSDSEFGKY